MFFCLNQADPDTLPITLTEDTSSSSSAIPSGVDPAVVMPAETSSTSLAVMSSKRFYGSSLAKPERERRLRKKPRRYQ